MTTTEHLQKIKAKCQQLLDIAAKRTQGRWLPRDNHGNSATVLCDSPSDSIYRDAVATNYGDRSLQNATFIAACAGPAEAGWKATVAAISWLETSYISVYLPEREEAERVERDILAAWPIELFDS